MKEKVSASLSGATQGKSLENKGSGHIIIIYDIERPDT
jgi:hypothetical protein